ncbi:DUF5672 family protein [Paraburkholderia haematera]|uniref:DUF5672 domain-containing protein n=1 Tax=Paraburkholderia haematera TaxID=2793077 RepID=A0ABM8RB30_9BURK|nr:DUF5672 family protein [Paraburkholderia haematera]CAE6743079.1 hypothetical protein R69888_02613 [Paraburkholderia haematera]
MNNRPPIDLRSVTLCAADSLNPHLALHALRRSARLCTFGDVILFTHEEIPSDIRSVRIPRLQSRDDYSAFIFRDLVHHISTPWVLIAQWDGFVVDETAWSQSFLDYDYIGAKWPFHSDGLTVGNGGFSLRSARLLRACAEARFPFIPGVNEDELICRVYRSALEAECGIRFAPEPIAEQFSHERGALDNPTFGFHAAFNMWRHVDDTEMIEIIRAVDPRTIASGEMVELLHTYFTLRKFACLMALYARLRDTWTPVEIAQQIVNRGATKEAAVQCVNTCERIAQGG